MATSGDRTILRFGRPGAPPTWQHFGRPVAVLAAHGLDDVRPVLDAAESHAQRGSWAVGFVSYEAAPAFDPSLRVHPAVRGLPYAWFAIHEAPSEHSPSNAGPGVAAVDPSTSVWLPPDTATYLRAVERIHAEIADGNTYQVNYTERLEAELRASAESLFSTLVAQQPDSLAAYIDLGDFQIASVSPELFFERVGRTVTMRPMKGTVARGRSDAEDRRNRSWLRGSAKNRAENVMIVDLLRNDLSRIADTGSVQVGELLTLETYPTFHALTSTIRAATSATLAEIFAALFPCGSVTGAPKSSTMRLIADLESAPRGVYCGAIGVLAPGGDARFSVAIRTAVTAPVATAPSPASAAKAARAGAARAVTYGVGSGITAGSDAAEEYAELITKSRILPGPDLLETFRIENGVAPHLTLHLARMRASATELRYEFDEQVVADAVRRLIDAHPSRAWRARLLLSRSGVCRGEATGFDPTQLQHMTARLSDSPVDATDPRLRHKLTDRTTYDARRLDGADTTLLVNERAELTEFLFGNLVVRRGDRLLTPPLDCGLLPGIGRAIALADGVREAVIRIEDLASCGEIWHVNSLRGWSRVQLLAEPA